jgi:hypothetical protein
VLLFLAKTARVLGKVSMKTAWVGLRVCCCELRDEGFFLLSEPLVSGIKLVELALKSEGLRGWRGGRATEDGRGLRVRGFGIGKPKPKTGARGARRWALAAAPLPAPPGMWHGGG